jgi:quercetin dioxygenase-like cupin family protein
MQKLIWLGVASVLGASLIKGTIKGTPANTGPSLLEMRMTPREIQIDGPGATPNPKFPGVGLKLLFGDPTKDGFYSVMFFAPAHTTIQAHSHRDNRVATVVSGEWSVGYGTKFDEAALKMLPPGSVYSEPAGVFHFARTGDIPVIVHVCGYGPSDAQYFDSKDDPTLQVK